MTNHNNTLPKFLVKKLGEEKLREVMNQPVSPVTEWRRKKREGA